MDVRALPGEPCGTLHQTVLPAGTGLWRVHRGRYPADSFSPKPADVLFGGGRFDSTCADAYPFFYAGLTPETALCEALLRGLVFNGLSRQLPRAGVRGRVLSSLTTTVPLTMLSLTSAVDLASICQPDDWLVRADGHEYAQTRAWAHWLRKHASTVHGFVWRSRFNTPHEAIVLFGDRCPGNGTRVGVSIRLDDADGAAYLNNQLAPYRVTISPPRPAQVAGEADPRRAQPGNFSDEKTKQRKQGVDQAIRLHDEPFLS